jgi:5-dehydro-2-deoxygluconokinase
MVKSAKEAVLNSDVASAVILSKASRFSRNNFLVVGRAGLDIYVHPPGALLEEAEYFQSALGGSAANIAAGITRLGGKAALLTCVSDDAVGRYVLNQLDAYGIDRRHVFTVGGEARNSLAVVETRSENCQSVIYRNNAADFQLDDAKAESVDLAAFGALIVAGTSLALEPSRGAVMDLLYRAQTNGLPIVLDIDYRPYSWESGKVAKEVCGRAADISDIVIGNNEEFDLIADQPGSGRKKAEQLAEHGGVVCVYKMGENGSVTVSDATSFETSVFPVKALKPTGAGDAFMGAFCTSLAKGFDLKDAVRRGSAAAAIVVTKVGCAPATPTPQELADFIATHS